MYQLESTKVSIVSTSRRALPPQRGQVVFTHEATFARGGSPLPVRTSLTSMSGNTTGRSSSGTGMPLPSGSQRWQ